jgi:hypothetical protein
MELSERDLSIGKRLTYKYSHLDTVYGPVTVRGAVISGMDGSRVLVQADDSDEKFYLHISDDGDETVTMTEAP